MTEKIIAALAKQFELAESSITPETPLADICTDSIDFAELLTDLEEEYGISITDEGIYQVQTVKELADFVEKLL
ncbi:MAG: acyl carrier protein [Oscillospiraceae bacterium]|jgi:acyl carrier protein|nr:acyl carrier protein [Oscillospiraceae bacterium]